MKESDIRPDHLMTGQAERFAADIRRLLKHKSDFIKVCCPACRSENAEEAFEKYDLTYVVCSDCKTMYVNPRPTPAILEMYYANSENYAYWNNYIFPATEDARREKIFRPRVDRLAEICRRHEVERDVLLEVGAGFGTFCEEIRRVNLFRRVIAVEPTPDLAETCHLKGLEVISKPIEKVDLDSGTINVIVSFEVIEHLFDPQEFLESCARLLLPNGLLIITCPNVTGFDISILGAASDSVDAEHLNYFNPASLSQLVSACNFVVLEVLTPGKLDAELVRKKALKGEFDISKHPFLQTVLIDEWQRAGKAFQTFLADNGLSSHMWLVARK